MKTILRRGYHLFKAVENQKHVVTRGSRRLGVAMTTSPTPSLKRTAEDEGHISPPPVKRKATTAISQKAVSNFFKPASQKEPEKVSWKIRDGSLITARYYGSKERPQPIEQSQKRKIAAFDFDSTLIMTKSGNRFAKDASDWQWWHSSVPAKLRKMHEEGYLVAIVSNQGAIGLRSDSKTAKMDKKRLDQFKQRAVSVFNQLDIPISLYAATEKDIYRKPRVGMWQVLLEDHGLTPDGIDLCGSVFVGDAAGRLKEGSKKEDFSCSDRNFADNIGLPFHTPEEFFLGEQPKPFERGFQPSRYIQPIDKGSTDASPVPFSKKHDFDLVVFVGSPGSGKSSFFKRHLEPLGYARVNQDILKSRDKCVKVATEHLRKKESVAVDNTNRDRTTRKVWIDLAAQFKVPVRCVWFTAEPALCQHNDAVRALNKAHNPEDRAMLPGNAFPLYKNAFEPPDVEEGFEDVTRVDFVFEGTEEEKAIWSKYWI
ncbi:polynucleotide kinase 3'-phosphatase [Verruconis gallopava]|uniref:Polynucleotide kinase 3'-phosphatase n=1 Tax=Verruconis gallopava TaxID=253628 RepID=A0A0D2AFF1_9PEZI|nr:polynucleotide kinase 3'-phosphatase [Verruconis gallopava]KIW05210.1 polynucleotide kinase 3'-phosphatase [Verruconis gallopava]